MIYDKKRDKDRVILKVEYGVDYSKYYYDRVNDENKMAAYIQKELRNWWKKQSGLLSFPYRTHAVESNRGRTGELQNPLCRENERDNQSIFGFRKKIMYSMCVMKEEYRRYNETYEVSDLGNVKKDGVVLDKLSKDEYYYYVVSNGKPVRVHNMVGECFPEICGEKILFGHYHHLNHNQLDNRAENIRCISASEHRKLHQMEDGVSVSVKAYDKTGKFVGRWDSKTQAAEATGADYRHISSIIEGKGGRFTEGKLFWFKESVSEEEVQKKIIEMKSAKYQSLRKNSEKKCA